MGTIAIFWFLGAAAYWIFSCVRSNERRASEASQPQQRQQVTTTNNSSNSNSNSNSNNKTRKSRNEEMLYKFYFQTVLPDKSNTTADSFRSIVGAFGFDEEEGACSGGVTSEKITSDDTSSSSSSSTKPSSSSSPPVSLRNILASWRRPSQKDECCICLEAYKPGDTICVAKTSACDHVFHQECMAEWLQDNDQCPLCRVKLMD